MAFSTSRGWAVTVMPRAMWQGSCIVTVAFTSPRLSRRNFTTSTRNWLISYVLAAIFSAFAFITGSSANIWGYSTFQAIVHEPHAATI